MRSSLALPAGILLAYLALRAALLWTAFDTLVLPNYEQMPMGDIAALASSGWRGPGLAQFYDNCGGHLVVGLCAAPLFRLLGDSYLVLKLVPLGFGVAGVALAWAYLRRIAGPRAANLGVALLAFGPPTLVKLSVMAMGNHFEALVPQLACLYLFERLHTSDRPRRVLLLLAVAAGLAVSFYLGSLLLLSVLAVVHVRVRGVHAACSDAGVVLLPFAAGLAPLVWLNLSSGVRVAPILGGFFGAAPAPDRALGRAGELLALLPHAGVYPDLGPLPGALAGWVGLATFVLAWTFCAVLLARGVGRRRPVGGAEERARYQRLRLAPLVLYLPAFVVAYSAGTFRVGGYGPPTEVAGFRYLALHFTFAALLVAVAIDRAWSRRPALGATLLGAALLPAAFLAPLVDPSGQRSGIGLEYPGHDWSLYAHVVLRDPQHGPAGELTWDAEWVRAQVAQFDGRAQHAVARGVGHHLALAQVVGGRGPSAFSLGAVLDPYPASLHADLARGAGACLRTKLLEDPSGWTARLAELAAHDARTPFVVEGLARSLGLLTVRSAPSERQHGRALARAIPEEQLPAFRRGLGFVEGERYARGIALELEAIAAEMRGVASEGREDWCRGFGAGLASYERSTPLPDVLSKLPLRERGPLLAGMAQELARLLGQEEAVRTLDVWLAAWSVDDRAAAADGVLHGGR